MKSKWNQIYIGVFLGVLLAPLFTMNRAENVISEIDNRALVEAPILGKEGYTENVESYLKDRMGGRDWMINAYAILNDRIAGELTHPLYTYGKEGYVFFEMHENIEYGEYHETFVSMVVKVRDYCESRGSDFYLMFNPEKSSVYRRFLPNGVLYDDSWVTEMVENLQMQGVKVVDNTELLTELSFREDVFNKKYDAGHWNDRGCLYGLNALLEVMQQDNPTVTPISDDKLEKGIETATYLPNSRFTIQEDIPSYTLKTPYTLATEEWSDEIERDKQYSTFNYYINDMTEASGLPRLLSFQGSYLNSRPPLLAGSFKEYICVHNYQNVLNIDYYYNVFQPDIVLLDLAEYVVSDGYFSFEKMKSLEFNPAFSNFMNEEAEQIRAHDLETAFTEGDKVDRFYVWNLPDDVKHAYLMVDNKAYDMRETVPRVKEVSLRHGVLRDGNMIRLLFLDNNGKQFCSEVLASIKSEEDLQCLFEMSESE